MMRLLMMYLLMVDFSTNARAAFQWFDADGVFKVEGYLKCQYLKRQQQVMI